mmetsp:Transcript_5922/g.11420  ORF Transcript_5922/g.11420 Transcript_5922/m.11420 type:complete len:407 (-) Transcript_5922:19-1239(-)
MLFPSRTTLSPESPMLSTCSLPDGRRSERHTVHDPACPVWLRCTNALFSMSRRGRSVSGSTLALSVKYSTISPASLRGYSAGSTPKSAQPPTPSMTPVSVHPPARDTICTSSPPRCTLEGCGMHDHPQSSPILVLWREDEAADGEVVEEEEDVGLGLEVSVSSRRSSHDATSSRASCFSVTTSMSKLLLARALCCSAMRCRWRFPRRRGAICCIFWRRFPTPESRLPASSGAGNEAEGLRFILLKFVVRADGGPVSGSASLNAACSPAPTTSALPTHANATTSAMTQRLLARILRFALLRSDGDVISYSIEFSTGVSPMVAAALRAGICVAKEQDIAGLLVATSFTGSRLAVALTYKVLRSFRVLCIFGCLNCSQPDLLLRSEKSIQMIRSGCAWNFVKRGINVRG